jgi:hypothetical protein
MTDRNNIADLVGQFTQGEHAVVTVVAGEIERRGAAHVRRVSRQLFHQIAEAIGQ